MQTWFVSVAIVAFAICVFALLRGRGPERFVAIALTGEFVFHQVMQILGRPPPFLAVTGEQFIPNLLLLAVFVAIAVYANRTWTLGVAALQLLRTTSQVSAMVAPDGAQLAYWTMSQLPLGGELILLLCGVLAVERRRHFDVLAKDWR